NFLLGNNSGSFGYFGVSGGTNRINEFGVGSHNGGNGILNVTGGDLTVTDYFNIGRANSGTGQVGIVNLLGGVIRAQNSGNNGSEDVNLANSGGTAKNTVMTIGGTGQLLIAQRGLNFNNNASASNNASLNLNGGLLQTAWLRSSGTVGNQYLNFNGGTLAATATSGNFISGVDRITVNQGGAKFDTAGFNVTIGQSLQAPSGKGLSSVAIANGGSGYIAPPIVEISGGGGSGATAYAEIDRVTGAVTNIVISNPGNGYTTPPTVVLKQGGFITTATVGLVGLADNVSGGITKQGNGELLLTAGNTYTGATVVEKGTLKAGVSSNAFGITSAMVFSNVAGALADLNGFDQTIGS
ncbi:MAG: PEP-CTERM sorting domain-containing protein, partial [Verrucomicrobia bacterium]|nr:PEP-CTERM sorting domain-containing protein [Verrucomicrobiota bacterium]